MELSTFLKTIEILGLFAGVSYVIGAILEKRWCWYAGIIATILYAVSVYFGKLYGEFILQFFYLGISFYGLAQWNTLSKKKELPISYSSLKFIFTVFLSGGILTFGFYYLLLYFNGDYPFLDALTSGFGVVTTYMVAKKKIENWAFWIIIDIILSYIMYLKGYPFYCGLYVIYTVFSFYGFYIWKKEMG